MEFYVVETTKIITVRCRKLALEVTHSGKWRTPVCIV